jgi:hypothetical protein
MRNYRRQTTATLAAWLLVIAGAGAVRAQTTPPFNPNAESPVDDSEGTSATDGISDAVDDIDGIIEDTTGDIDGIIEDTTGDIDGAIQDQLGNVTDPLEEGHRRHLRGRGYWRDQRHRWRCPLVPMKISKARSAT